MNAIHRSAGIQIIEPSSLNNSNFKPSSPNEAQSTGQNIKLPEEQLSR